MSPSYAVQPADMRDVAQLRRALEAAGLHPQARIRDLAAPRPISGNRGRQPVTADLLCEMPGGECCPRPL